VPVFAAIDGTVVEVSDRLPDEHTAENMTVVDNHVIISSRNREIHTVYGHLRKGVLVRRGQHVVAGQQLGYTASSGHSTWPHLHFTARLGLDPYEPFAGPCRQGSSYWASQPPMPTEPYVRDFTFSDQPFGGRKDPPWDEAVRTGTFVRGERDVYFRVELAFFDGGPMSVTFLRPDGSTALDADRPTMLHGYRATWADFRERLDLDQPGRWRIRLSTDGKPLVDAPFDVVASRTGARNRPPNPVSVELATPDVVPQCLVHTSPVTEDPDFQIMRYRYRWFVGTKRVRSVTSAALSDVLRQGLARSGQTLTCKVTPSDGRLSGPRASAAVRLG
jgi:murein DD-endopeptidase MepM/ murein hydrolase activator NlpD